MKLAILGYGVVGSGVAGVIDRCAKQLQQRTGIDLTVAAIVDVRSFPDDPCGHLVTADADSVFSNPDIGLVVETIGGIGVAYDFTKKALQAGKHVVTSNKELVSTHGPELLRLAAEHRVRYLYEAAVGGGIPLIRPLHKDLAANRIEALAGIVNGTTNFILTEMEEQGSAFAACLAEAQARGYAEQDPAADIEGLDACRKLSILASIVAGAHVPAEAIYTEGISQLQAADTALAKALGYHLKLIASLKRTADDRFSLIVAPHLLAPRHALAGVNGVFNAVQVTGDSVGDVLFYGQGAGTWPTASAVVADVIDLATTPYAPADRELWEPIEPTRLIPHAEATVQAVLRLAQAEGKAADELLALLPAGTAEKQTAPDGTPYLLVGDDQKLTEGDLAAALAQLEQQEIGLLRIL